jgi:hypothetical protein
MDQTAAKEFINTRMTHVSDWDEEDIIECLDVYARQRERQVLADFVRRVEEQEFNTDSLCTDCSEGYTFKRLFEAVKAEMEDGL